MLAQAELKDRLSYDPETGVFVWIKPAWNKTQYIGKRAGSLDGDGYITIKIDSVLYKAHNLAWLYVNGVWPTLILDHRDGVKANNAIANLREVSYAGNSQNQRRAHVDSAAGLIGVDYHGAKRLFRARIQADGKRVYLGHYRTAAEAHGAYLRAKRAFHETCTI